MFFFEDVMYKLESKNKINVRFVFINLIHIHYEININYTTQYIKHKQLYLYYKIYYTHKHIFNKQLKN